MAFRLYLVPKIGAGAHGDYFRPQYFTDGTISNTNWSGMDYLQWFIVAADLSPADDATIDAQPQAFGIPFDLSVNLTGPQVTAVTNKLEAMNLPAGWVTTAFTWQEVMRIVLGIFVFMQRFTGVNGGVGLFTAGITLASTMSQLSGPVQANLTSAADSMGLDHSGVTGATTIRAMLKTLGTQFQQRPYTFNGTVI